MTDDEYGHILTTELNSRSQAAQADLQQAGVSDAVTILTQVTAFATLAALPTSTTSPCSTAGRTSACPCFRSSSPRLAPGALVAADDNTLASMSGYLAYVRNPANGYATVVLPGRGRHGDQLLDRPAPVIWIDAAIMDR